MSARSRVRAARPITLAMGSATTATTTLAATGTKAIVVDRPARPSSTTSATTAHVWIARTKHQETNVLIPSLLPVPRQISKGMVIATTVIIMPVAIGI